MQNYGFTVILIEIIFLFKLKNHIKNLLGGRIRGYTGTFIASTQNIDLSMNHKAALFTFFSSKWQKPEFSKLNFLRSCSFYRSSLRVINDIS